MKKLFLVLLGIILSVLLLEAALQLTGIAMKFAKRAEVRRALAYKGEITILCIGESTTDGQWPRFLKAALTAAGVEKEITVIDKGVGGTYTGAILRNFPLWIKEYKPDIVVAMMGINDEDNYAVAARRTKLRTVKLFYMLKHHLRSNKTGGAPSADSADAAHVNAGSAHSEIPLEVLEKINLAKEMYVNRKYYEAVKLLEPVLEEYPQHLINAAYYYLLASYQLAGFDDSKVFAVIRKALELNKEFDCHALFYAFETKNRELFIEIFNENPAMLKVDMLRVKQVFPDLYDEVINVVMNLEKRAWRDYGFKAIHYLSLGNYAKADKYFNEMTGFYMNNINSKTQNNYLAVAYSVDYAPPKRLRRSCSQEVLYVINNLYSYSM